MKNILIRSGISPFDNFDAAHIIANNSIGGNVGNLVYAYSVLRTLMTKDTTITPDYYRINPQDADKINETYDCYVIPLADAFREDFVPSLQKYTKLIKKLKIPVIVIGVGLRAPFEPKLEEGFPFDDDVKTFVSAILEKSEMIGVRGEITSKYLSRLGFKEGIDHTVIGCPSMYTFGRELNIRDTNITKDSMVCVNSSRLSPDNVLDFISRSMEEFPNHYFIPQWFKEMRLIYAGAPSLPYSSSNYPVKMTDPVYRNNRVRFPLNVPTWLDFLKQADLSFGARLHGNITATIAGTPSILLPKDARMRELAVYHGLTHVWGNEITEQTFLSDLIEQCDFQLPTKKQGKNFDHFINFLNKNKLDHIYRDSLIPDTVPLDDELSKIKLKPLIWPISSCNIDEMVDRWEKYYQLEEDKQKKKMDNKNKELTKKNKRLGNKNTQIEEQNNTIKSQQKTISKLQGTLQRKSVRFALNAANIFRTRK